jgi:hypothetical protein
MIIAQTPDLFVTLEPRKFWYDFKAIREKSCDWKSHTYCWRYSLKGRKTIWHSKSLSTWPMYLSNRFLKEIL